LVTKGKLGNINCQLNYEGARVGYDYDQCVLLNHIEKYNTGQTKINIYCERIGCLDLIFEGAIWMTDQYGPWPLIENNNTGSYFAPAGAEPYMITPDNTLYTYYGNCYGCQQYKSSDVSFMQYGLGLEIGNLIVYSNYIPEPTGIVYATIQINAIYADGTYHPLKNKTMFPVTTKIVDTNSSGNHVYECVFEDIDPWNLSEGTMLTPNSGVIKELNVQMVIFGDA
jgi:hypothetical protein